MVGWVYPFLRGLLHLDGVFRYRDDDRMIVRYSLLCCARDRF